MSLSAPGVEFSKAASINMFKELKEAMFKKLKKNLTRNQQIKILKKETEITQRINENLASENTITEIKNSL